MDYIKDPYFNINKTNHLLNYKVLLILKEIKDLIAFQLKEKISHKFKKANQDSNNNKKR